MNDEDVRVLWRAYVALTLAHEAAERCAGATAHDPCLQTVINNQRLAMRELDGLLGRAFACDVAEPLPADAEETCAALVM